MQMGKADGGECDGGDPAEASNRGNFPDIASHLDSVQYLPANEYFESRWRQLILMIRRADIRGNADLSSRRHLELLNDANNLLFALEAWAEAADLDGPAQALELLESKNNQEKNELLSEYLPENVAKLPGTFGTGKDWLMTRRVLSVALMSSKGAETSWLRAEGQLIAEQVNNAADCYDDFDQPLMPELDDKNHVNQRKIAAKAIANSKRPVIYSDADFNTRSLGMLGMHGPRGGDFPMDEADLIIAIDARLDYQITGKMSEFAPNAKVIHIDTDMIKKNGVQIDNLNEANNIASFLQKEKGPHPVTAEELASFRELSLVEQNLLSGASDHACADHVRAAKNEEAVNFIVKEALRIETGDEGELSSVVRIIQPRFQSLDQAAFADAGQKERARIEKAVQAHQGTLATGVDPSFGYPKRYRDADTSSALEMVNPAHSRDRTSVKASATAADLSQSGHSDWHQKLHDRREAAKAAQAELPDRPASPIADVATAADLSQSGHSDWHQKLHDRHWHQKLHYRRERAKASQTKLPDWIFGMMEPGQLAEVYREESSEKGVEHEYRAQMASDELKSRGLDNDGKPNRIITVAEKMKAAIVGSRKK